MVEIRVLFLAGSAKFIYYQWDSNDEFDRKRQFAAV